MSNQQPFWSTCAFGLLFDTSYPRGEEENPEFKTATLAWNNPDLIDTLCVNLAKSCDFSVLVIPQWS